jgi:uridine kinase
MKDVDEEVARRAYRRHEERGDRPGSDLEDWLAAKKEVDAEIERERSKSDDAKEIRPSKG